jgi:CheY-like chemotaxis protein
LVETLKEIEHNNYILVNMTKKIIMMVDDEESLLELLRGLFEAEGYDVVTVASGQECLNKLKSMKPDIILMDMMMPGMSGRETTEKIRQDPKTKGVKVIFLTVARFSETGIKNLKDLGVVDYINKPFENTELVSKVKKILG